MNFYVYIMSNASRTLYIGVTDDLKRRVSQHRMGLGGEFTRKYHCHKLVWHEHFRQISNAIAVEKKLKGWTRAKEIALIEAMNPGWRELMPAY